MNSDSSIVATDALAVTSNNDSMVKKEMPETTESFHIGVKLALTKLMYWDDILQSALVLAGGSMFYLLTHILDYPMISLGSWVLIVFISLSAIAKFVTLFMGAIGMTPYPMLARLQAGVPSPLFEESAVIRRTKEFVAISNMIVSQWNDVLAFSDVVMTTKVVLALYAAVRLFQVISLTTLMFTAFTIGMIVPKVYHDNQSEIDAATLKVLTEMKVKLAELKEKTIVVRGEICVKSQAALEDGKIKYNELKVLLHAKLVELIASLPPHISAKVTPYLPVSLVAVPEVKSEKLD